MDLIELWIVLGLIVVVTLFLFGMEIIKQYKDPDNTHYNFDLLFGKADK